MPAQMDSQPGQIQFRRYHTREIDVKPDRMKRTNSIWHFRSFQTWGCIHPTTPAYFFSLCFLFLACFLNWRSGWQDGHLPGSKVVSHFRAQRCSCVYKYALQIWLHEAAINVCGQWMDVLTGLVEVWWRYVHWIPFLDHLWHDFGVDLGS